ncbi:MAG TPA: hypothetical protein VFV10_21140 [Gammaproteobacteria bacterium]|nr:hypothetical protein [Gammaproteobacteria bacterium]
MKRKISRYAHERTSAATLTAFPAAAAALLAAALLAAQGARAEDRVTAGDASVEPPTLVSLGVDWLIDGDDDRDARVDVEYRKAGETEWHEGLPLLRLQREQVNGRVGGPSYLDAAHAAESAAALAAARSESAPGGTPPPGAAASGPFAFSPFSYTSPNMFSGSVFDLTPNTEYEIRLTLSDPDGVSGRAQRTLRAHTRPEPMPAAGGKVYHVYPVGYEGPRQEPSFTGLMAAYYMGAAHFDYENAYPPRVQPGDTILVHAGLYVSDRHHYMNRGPAPGYLALGTVFDGTYYLSQSGTPNKPIVIKAAGDGEVVFDGDGAENLFNLMAANYNYFEGITVRNTNVAFLLGIKGIGGASGFTLKRSRIENVGRGIEDDWSGSKDFYIADNVFMGRHAPDHMMGWIGAIWEPFPDFPERLDSEYAIKVYGQGHVVTRNYIANWHDGIDMATYGNPDGTPNVVADRFPMSIDFYENDITNMGDNCIETDGGGRNMRVFRNRCFNTASQGLSAQPIFGGPVYFVRNLVYNGPGAGSLKFVSTPTGALVYQNTFVGEVSVPGPASNEHFRNNLILAQGATDAVLRVGTFTNYSSSDYNGFRPNPNAEAAFEWSSPPFEKLADYIEPPVQRKFRTLAEYRQATGQDLHSRLVDYDVFVRVTPPDMRDPRRLYEPATFDFALRPGSAAVDAGTVLPNVTDGFTGAAPDLGALEIGAPAPRYGPR